MLILYGKHNNLFYRLREIKGNVIVLASLCNNNSIIHPYFFSDYLIASSFIEPNFIGDHISDPQESLHTKLTNKKEVIFSKFSNNIPKKVGKTF